MTKLTNPAKFFDMLRKGKLLGPVLEQSEVQGCELIVNACSDADWPISWTAYALATAYHETAHSMQPIKEMGGPAYFRRMYDVEGNRPALAKANGNTTPGDGAKYYGRGYVQITWKTNYEKAEKVCKISGILKNPDLALKPENASKILVSGMGQGWFTGKSCKTYLPTIGSASVDQFVQSRKIINGTDKAEMIAAYAVHFQDCLIAGEYK